MLLYLAGPLQCKYRCMNMSTHMYTPLSAQLDSSTTSSRARFVELWLWYWAELSTISADTHDTANVRSYAYVHDVVRNAHKHSSFRSNVLDSV